MQSLNLLRTSANRWARTAAARSGARLPTAAMPVCRQSIRRASAQAEGGAPLPQRSGSNTLLVTAALGILAAGGYYYYTSPEKTQELKQAITPTTKALDPKKFQSFALKFIEPISHNTKLYRFELPEPNMVLGLDVASCIVTKFVDEKNLDKDGKPKVVIRPYTPTSKEDERGYFDLIVKEYPQGVMSRHIASLKPGDKLDVKGPIPKYPYTPNMHKEVGLIAGGTGITPMLQLIRKIFNNPEDHTKVSLIFANIAENDILMRPELDRLAEQYPDRFHVYYTLDNPEVAWKLGRGFITKEMAKEHLPEPSTSSNDMKLFVCGPPPMVKAISGSKASMSDQGPLTGILKELGYTEAQVFKF
ncbi:NADH-cytochrome b5 reductase [Dimargaris verticillata]|uniref:NADH-cytochrome b5 reductase n=1 Tax=Dimargaris verticillata TaxID=2761393 RepID=A0A9W8EEI0_9FUNG|nr:NADH-cytochrome b5 reductase [Dimargaris verticillata]